MALPLMPKATAIWLIENTTLSFEQIANFCGMHPMEVQGIADGEVAVGIIGIDPVASGQLSQDNIKECEENPKASLKLTERSQRHVKKRGRGGKYTPIARRQDKPDAISWLLKYHPELTDANIIKLIGTTRNTINAIRERSHWNINNIKPRDPVLLGLCKQLDLDNMVAKAKLLNPQEANSSTEEDAVDVEDTPKTQAGQG